MLNLPDPSPNTQTLEPWIRAALSSGELTPAAEDRINQVAEAIELSAGDRRLLALLHDAIQEGFVQRVQPVYVTLQAGLGESKRAETEVF